MDKVILFLGVCIFLLLLCAVIPSMIISGRISRIEEEMNAKKEMEKTKKV